MSYLRDIKVFGEGRPLLRRQIRLNVLNKHMSVLYQRTLYCRQEGTFENLFTTNNLRFLFELLASIDDMLHVRREFVIWWFRNNLLDQRDAHDIVVNEQNVHGTRPNDTLQMSRTGIALLQSGYLPISIIHTRFAGVLAQRNKNIFSKVASIRNNFVSLTVANKNRNKNNIHSKWNFVESIPNQSRILHWNTVIEALHQLEFDFDNNARIQILNGNLQVLGEFVDRLFEFIATEDAISRAPIQPPQGVITEQKQQDQQSTEVLKEVEPFYIASLLNLINRKILKKRNQNLTLESFTTVEEGRNGNKFKFQM